MAATIRTRYAERVKAMGTSRCLVYAAIFFAVPVFVGGVDAEGGSSSGGQLEKLRSTFAELKEDTFAPQKSFETRYEAELERLAESAKAKGDLELVIAVGEEVKAFRSRGSDFEFSRHQDLARLQGIYKDQITVIAEGQRTNLLRLSEGYRSQLESLRDQMTREDNIEGAVAAQAELRLIEGELEALAPPPDKPDGGRPPLGFKEPPPLEIVEAYYDSYERMAGSSPKEVTEVLRGKIVDGKIDLPVNNSVFGDPHPFVAKVLKVKYFKSGKGQRPGVPFEKTVGEGGRLVLP